MKLNKRTFVTLSALAFVSIFSINWSSNPPIDRTNRPNSQGNCTGCHSGTLNPTGGSYSVTGTNSYYPGKSYTITAALTGGTKYGFQMTAVRASSTTVGAGSFSGTGFNTTTQGGRPYARHSGASSTSSYGVTWAAPSTNVGTVTIYAAGVAANGNFSTSGDKTYTTTKTITGLNKITFGYDTTSVACANESNGKIKIKNVTGGAGAPYTYSWDSLGTASSATSDSLVDLAYGTYKVTVTDSDNNSESLTISLGSPSAISNTLLVTPSVCSDSTGWAVPRTSGGNAPYTYSWPQNVIVSNDSAINLKAGSYIVTIEDAKGCSITDTAIIGTSGSNISFTVDTKPEFCGNGWGEASISNIQNTVGNITYRWSNGKTTPSINSLIAMGYDVTITDAAGCSSTQRFGISSQTNNINFTISKNDDKCNNKIGIAKVIGLSGGKMPYSFAWDNGSTLDSANNLGAGTYSVTVTDSVQCSTVKSVTINDADAPQISFNGENLKCFGDSSGRIVSSISSGTPPYSYTWSNNNSDSVVSNLSAGINYVLTVTDANGCLKIDSISLTEPTLLKVDSSYQITDNDGTCDESAAVNVSGGTGTYFYLWSNNASDSLVTGLCAGSYSVTVTDANSCETVNSIDITDNDLTSVFEKSYKQFSLFPIPVKNSLNILSPDKVSHVQILDLGGNLLINELNAEKTIDVSNLESGVYIIRIRFDNQTESQQRFIKQ